jgi:hypothetical protein
VVNLDGSGSSDAEGSIASYSWAFVSTPGAVPALTGAGTATPSFTPSDVGGYTVELTVTDGDGAPATDQVVVTAGAPPPANFMHVGDLDGSSTLSGGNGPVRWTANVVVAVEDGDSNPVVGATVTGNFAPKAGNGKSCTTVAGGRCTIQSRNIQERRTTMVTFTVTGVTLGGLIYDSGANDDPDEAPPEDVSNGTVIVVFAP